MDLERKELQRQLQAAREREQALETRHEVTNSTCLALKHQRDAALAHAEKLTSKTSILTKDIQELQKKSLAKSVATQAIANGLQEYSLARSTHANSLQRSELTQWIIVTDTLRREMEMELAIPSQDLEAPSQQAALESNFKAIDTALQQILQRLRQATEDSLQSKNTMRTLAQQIINIKTKHTNVTTMTHTM